MEDLQEALGLSLKVLADWRVLFIAVAVLLVWSALRYVGMVYHRRPRSRPLPPPLSAQGASKPSAKGAAASSARSGGEAEEEVIE